MRKSILTVVTILILGILATVGTGAAKTPKVALLLAGTIDDQGWNASAYEGLMALKNELGAEVAYSEKIAISDYEEVFRGYAVQGFDVIIGHAFAFGDPAKQVAKDFPDVKFIITSSDTFQEPNVCSLDNDNVELGFLAGAVATLVTKTNVIASVGAMKVPAVVQYQEGFEAGAKFLNPDIKVLSAITGDFWDAAKAKETTIALINQKADVVTHLADRAGLGVIDAAKEKKVFAVGNVGDQAALAPDTVVTSAVAKMSNGFVKLVQMALDGTLKAQSYRMGIKEGVVGLAPYRQFEDKLTKAQKDTIESLVKDIETGKLDVRSLLEK